MLPEKSGREDVARAGRIDDCRHRHRLTSDPVRPSHREAAVGAERHDEELPAQTRQHFERGDEVRRGQAQPEEPDVESIGVAVDDGRVGVEVGEIGKVDDPEAGRGRGDDRIEEAVDLDVERGDEQIGSGDELSAAGSGR